jgi:hypothetical protein
MKRPEQVMDRKVAGAIRDAYLLFLGRLVLKDLRNSPKGMKEGSDPRRIQH